MSLIIYMCTSIKFDKQIRNYSELQVRMSSIFFFFLQYIFYSLIFYTIFNFDVNEINNRCVRTYVLFYRWPPNNLYNSKKNINAKSVFPSCLAYINTAEYHTVNKLFISRNTLKRFKVVKTFLFSLDVQLSNKTNDPILITIVSLQISLVNNELPFDLPNSYDWT